MAANLQAGQSYHIGFEIIPNPGYSDQYFIKQFTLATLGSVPPPQSAPAPVAGAGGGGHGGSGAPRPYLDPAEKDTRIASLSIFKVIWPLLFASGETDEISAMDKARYIWRAHVARTANPAIKPVQASRLPSPPPNSNLVPPAVAQRPDPWEENIPFDDVPMT